MVISSEKAVAVFGAISVALTLTLAASGCGGGEVAGPVKPDRINVLLVTIDTLRADYLGCYGNKVVKTPEIDRIAAEGARFDFCVAHNPITLPSHTNILTGTDSRVHGVHDNHGFQLKEDAVTLAETMKTAGYDTAAFIGAFVLARNFGLAQGFDLYDDNLDAGFYVPLMGVERRADAVVANALEWIAGHKGGQPWFVWIHLYDPHAPYKPPAPFDTEFASNPYAGEISYVDAELGKLITYLRSENLIDSTLLVLTADHGEGLGDHGELTHGVFAYNTTIHVPLIIRAPWLVSGGTEIKRRVRHIDLLPTIIESVGGKLPGAAQGESLLPLLRGDESSPAPDSYFEALSASFNRGWAPLRGVFHENWKYIELPQPELYDMANDPGEQQDLVQKQAGSAQGLRATLHKMMETAEAATDARIKEDEETRRKLAALGYLSGSVQELKEDYGPGDDPKNLVGIDARLERAREAASSGDADHAIEILRELIPERPEMALSYQLLANLLAEKGRSAEAASCLEQAVGKGVGGKAVLYQLATLLLRVGKSDRAIAILEDLIKLDADDLEPARLLASWYDEHGEPAKAESIYLKAIEHDPASATARTELGCVLAKQGRFEEAIEQFNAAVHYQPDYVLALEGRGEIYEQTGMLDKAEESFRKILSINVMHHIARLHLGFTLIRKGNFQEARNELSQVLELAKGPQFAEVRKEASIALDRIRRSGR
jgi:arylsulfatase A-like enzyme/Tfp pilus assembly protein PilF